MWSVEHLLPVQNEMGETPIWIPEEQALYWVDAARATVFRYDPDTGERQSFSPDMPVRALCRRASGDWLIITDTGLDYLLIFVSYHCRFIIWLVAATHSSRV